MVQVLLLILQLQLGGSSMEGLKFTHTRLNLFQFVGNRRTEDIPEVPFKEEEEKTDDEEKKDEEKTIEKTG